MIRARDALGRPGTRVLARAGWLSNVGSSRDKITCDVLLPCLDEAEALPWILGRMPPGFQPIVIDNGSRTARRQLAADLGAIVVNAARRGYGSACHAGLVAATAPLVAVIDADASLDPAQLPDLIDPLARDRADLVVGVRRLAHRRAQPWTLRFANAELARRVRRRTGLPLRDIGPMHAAWREALLELKVAGSTVGIPGRDRAYAPPTPAGALLRSTPTISSARVARR